MLLTPFTRLVRKVLIWRCGMLRYLQRYWPTMMRVTLVARVYCSSTVLGANKTNKIPSRCQIGWPVCSPTHRFWWHACVLPALQHLRCCPVCVGVQQFNLWATAAERRAWQWVSLCGNFGASDEE